VPRSLRFAVLCAVLALVAVTAACGGGGSSAGDRRAEQVRAAATKAGLPDDVADVLALASRGPTATFRISYPGTDGAALVVSQQAPDRRVDVLSHGQVVESRLARHGVAYRCDVDTSAKAGAKGSYAALRCVRAAGDLPATGAFTTEALATFSKDLASSLDKLDLSVTHRTIAKTKATCLVSAPKPGTVLTGNDLSADTLCVSAEGAQLLVDAKGQRLVADSYTTSVPKGTFDV
jgi:hypothetical protein